MASIMSGGISLDFLISSTRTLSSSTKSSSTAAHAGVRATPAPGLQSTPPRPPLCPGSPAPTDPACMGLQQRLKEPELGDPQWDASKRRETHRTYSSHGHESRFHAVAMTRARAPGWDQEPTFVCLQRPLQTNDIFHPDSRILLLVGAQEVRHQLTRLLQLQKAGAGSKRICAA